MAQESRRHEITLRTVVYQIPGADALQVDRDVTYAHVGGEDLTLDIYHPDETARAGRTPAVVFVTGYPDSGMRKVVGCIAKEMASYVSWARLAAASGIVGVTYTNQDPARDVRNVIRYLRDHSNTLGIAVERIALWACSGNGPTAFALLMDSEAPIRRAVFCYAYLLDTNDEVVVANAARKLGFANPCAGRSIHDVNSDTALLIVRAGQDQMPGLNASSDRFVARALDRNLPLTLINHHMGPHAFDLFDESEAARHTIENVLTFLRLLN